jgi:hypothetical protein
MEMVFRNQGRVIRGVNVLRGDRDLDTGEAHTSYETFTTLALFATEEWRSKNFLNLRENMIVLERQAQFVVSDTIVYKTSLEQKYQKWYIYHIDKVVNDAVYMAATNQ